MRERRFGRFDKYNPADYFEIEIEMETYLHDIAAGGGTDESLTRDNTNETNA